ncbi:MAG TPA: D-glycerate dehydrogenase [Tepidiformaceae bacterium]|nr:D-glycerate dehydrogenase [Tepidiformaceae bacterium]HMO95196.1 D-glycerate dehydrogenase [Tepidiformaceae bacterium]
MEDSPKVLVTVAVPPEVEASLRAVCDVTLVHPATPRPEIIALLRGVEGLLCPAPFPIDNELLDAAPNLRVIANFGVGFNNVDLEELDRRGIVCCNTPGVLSDAVADLTMGLILAAARHIVPSANYASSGAWAAREPGPPLGFDVAGKTLGLIGFGRIGRATAKRAFAFGMQVVAHDVVAPQSGDPELMPLDALLRQSDIVSIHVNLTPQTTHLISTRELSLMKRTAWIVNTARGPVIDQVALTKALREGVIAGAALDVLEVEPPDPGDPLLSLENAIVLPHLGSATVETRAAMLDLAVRNLCAVIEGRNPPECVNPASLGRAFIRR